jgi:Ca2+-binding RTX toxin-like protein
MVTILATVVFISSFMLIPWSPLRSSSYSRVYAAGVIECVGPSVCNGTAGDDNMKGDADPNVMNGRAGNDHMSGGGGNDGMDGAGGNDKMSGGDGNDALGGTDGNDVVSGEEQTSLSVVLGATM